VLTPPQSLPSMRAVGLWGAQEKETSIMRIIRILAIGCALLLPLSISPESAKAGGEGKHLGTGHASYYGNEFSGRRTASGEKYTPGALTAAHRTVRFGGKVRVTHIGNGREVTVRVNDRGPFVKGRVIDLSYAAAQKIGLHKSGTARVRLTLVE
jgi:rare lipoprotein A